jgi:cytoskeletal protein RodZ
LPPVPANPIRVPETVNGAVLKTLRESRNLSIEQIAGLSKVGSRFLKALEEDRHETLPGRVFARGFLIEYARAIGASESEIVERYLKHWTAK